jgi:small subunit ribosomal protein S11
MAKKKKRKTKTIPTAGKVHITAGFNNTLISVTDLEGNTLFFGSAGKAGFRGSRKSTPYAASKAAEGVATAAKKAGMQEVVVLVNGPGSGRITAIKAFKAAGLRVTAISDVTRVPHNGCRAKSPRRV